VCARISESEAPYRVRDIRTGWDTRVTKIDVGREIRNLKVWKDGAQGRGLIVTFADKSIDPGLVGREGLYCLVGTTIQSISGCNSPSGVQ
jgi:hypothetical protein